MADIFISYSHLDRDVARSIADLLTTLGASVWWDRELIAGDAFEEVIQRELSTTGCAIVLWTKNSLGSRYVRDEAGVIADKRKLIPIAFDQVDPPLGFRTFQLLRATRTDLGDSDFLEALQLAVEQKLNRRLAQPKYLKVDKETSLTPNQASASEVPLAREGGFTTIAISDRCVWLGSRDGLEVYDSGNGQLIGRTVTAAEVLIPEPTGKGVISFESAIGYQSPDTLRLSRCKLSGSIDHIRSELLSAERYVPGPWESSRDEVIKATLGESIIQTNLFHTWAWQPGPVALSQDGHQIAVYVDVPDRRVEIRSIDTPDAQPAKLLLGDCHPDALLFLTNANEIVTLERQGNADGSSRLCLWDTSAGKRVAHYDLDYMSINCFCRLKASRVLALGLDSSAIFIDVDNGNIENQIKLHSRPVQACAFDPDSNCLALLTEAELITADTNTGHISKTLGHSGEKSVACDVRGPLVAAVVTAADQSSKLILWNHLS